MTPAAIADAAAASSAPAAAASAAAPIVKLPPVAVYSPETIARATRSRNRKLLGYGPHVVNCAVGKTTGMNVLSYICEYVHKIADGSANLKMDFWKDFFEEFELGIEYFPRLKPPTTDVELDNMANESLVTAFQSNPVGRSGDQFAVHMASLDGPMGTEELRAVIMLIKPSSTITELMNLKMSYAILGHIGMYTIHKSSPTFWDECVDTFDSMSVRMFQENPGICRDRFVGSNRLQMAPLLDEDYISTYLEHIEKKRRSPSKHRQVLSSIENWFRAV